jgi:hypothetical protein
MWYRLEGRQTANRQAIRLAAKPTDTAETRRDRLSGKGMEDKQTKFFNTCGPCFPDEHYMLPAVERIVGIDDLISSGINFVLQAPRQSGKTTSAHSAVEKINNEGKYYALYCTLEAAGVFSDIPATISFLCSIIRESLLKSGIPELQEVYCDIPVFDPGNTYGVPKMDLVPDTYSSILNVATAVSRTLSAICCKLDRELIVFLDEIDRLTGDVMITFLSNLRSGYVKRKAMKFPRSIALIGTHSIRDFMMESRPDSESNGSATPFNVVEPMTLANFTSDEVKSLYRQHTLATGQRFDDHVGDRVMYWTNGQPWLVNALPSISITRLFKSDFSIPVTVQHIDEATEYLKLRCLTHTDPLLSRLHEPRVQNVMETIFTGSKIQPDHISDDDLQYCLDIGLINQLEGTYSPANLIYADIFVRFLTSIYQKSLPRELADKFIGPEGPDMSGLLKDFQMFLARNSGMMATGFSYKQCDAHFSLFGYMHKAFNGRVQVINEFASGTGFVDICAIFKNRSFPVEIIINDSGYSQTGSITQLQRHMNLCVSSEGWLVVFDRHSDKSWSDRLSWETMTLPNGSTLHVVGC